MSRISHMENRGCYTNDANTTIQYLRAANDFRQKYIYLTSETNIITGITSITITYFLSKQIAIMVIYRLNRPLFSVGDINYSFATRNNNNTFIHLNTTALDPSKKARQSSSGY